MKDTRLEELIEFITEFSKHRTPLLMPEFFVCHGVSCEDFEISKLWDYPIDPRYEDMPAIRKAFPEHFI